MHIFLKNDHPRPLFGLFLSFQKTLQFLQVNVKNIHPVYGAGTQTHVLQT